ncbi:MAG: bifunctional diaminohydroxyphosphoribosylaminopyrimidine deaminase/5-amino-6-(5-phosphoribosylamino)uracil reductase RibD [Eubacteriales bacterium]|nr:bifunctional diaminohydroxyphosphoribosylaminopyrimidine deaminase/5-amino-6-(5-phosphoribosylamino)uracil reductase RibD [Eubacteriales bacterium]
MEEKKRLIDMEYMRRALALAENGIGKTSPNPLVGAVIVKNGRIIGEGWHEKYGEVHAEVNAVRNSVESVESAEIYVNLEPCCHYGKTPPCAELLIEKGIKRVVIGAPDSNPKVEGAGIKRLREAGVEVTVGVMEEECRKLNEVFFYYHEKRRPFVVVKTAISLDGKTTAPSGESKWITGEAARNEVQHLRNRYSAIMVGIGTVIKDDPELTCRLEGGKNPVRIILDSSLRIKRNSRVLTDQQRNPTIIACTDSASSERASEMEALGAKVLRCKSLGSHVDLEDLMDKLKELAIDSILLEGGSAVNDAAFSQGIASKVIMYIAPKIIGGEKSKTFAGGKGIDQLNQAYPVWIESIDRVGGDIKITAYLKEMG